MNSTSTLTRWDPFRDIATLQERLGRILGEPATRGTGIESVGWFPLVDITEEEDKIVLRAEVPGVDRADIDVNVENGMITIRGEKRQEAESTAQNAYRMERFYGVFSRSFALPTSVDPDQIKATYRNGVLEVILPKAQEARPRRIEIGGDGEEQRGERRMMGQARSQQAAPSSREPRESRESKDPHEAQKEPSRGGRGSR